MNYNIDTGKMEVTEGKATIPMSEINRLNESWAKLKTEKESIQRERTKLMKDFKDTLEELKNIDMPNIVFVNTTYNGVRVIKDCVNSSMKKNCYRRWLKDNLEKEEIALKEILDKAVTKRIKMMSLWELLKFKRS